MIVPSALGDSRLERLLDSLTTQTLVTQTIVVDNGSPDRSAAQVAKRYPFAECLRLEANVGFSRAVNLAAQRANGDALVLVNDDCTCDAEFVRSLTLALAPARGVVMAAGVLRDSHRPDLIDTAGIATDATLLIFDYLNGRPMSILDDSVPDPLGPCGAAAAYDRKAFLAAGGFDENLFAYWEDVDLALRLIAAGGRCVLASDARGVHDHSGTLGSGSSGKNYLIGYGRGYLLRKWSVLESPLRAAQAVTGDVSICLGQALVDRTVAGARGRLDGFRAARGIRRHPYPVDVMPPPGRPLHGSLASRVRRRLRILRRR